MGKLDGSCLCGAVTYGCDAEPVATAVCHCTECQKQTGSSFSVLVAVPRDALEVKGDTLASFTTVGTDTAPGRVPSVLPRLRLADREPRGRAAPGGLHQGGHAQRHLLARADGARVVRLRTALGSARGPGGDDAPARRARLTNPSDAGENGLRARVAADDRRALQTGHPLVPRRQRSPGPRPARRRPRGSGTRPRSSRRSDRSRRRSPCASTPCARGSSHPRARAPRAATAP